MIWEQRENVEGQPIFITEVGGLEYVVAQIEGETGWWLIPENPGGFRPLRGLLQHALVEAAEFIREASA